MSLVASKKIGVVGVDRSNMDKSTSVNHPSTRIARDENYLKIYDAVSQLSSGFMADESSVDANSEKELRKGARKLDIFIQLVSKHEHTSKRIKLKKDLKIKLKKKKKISSTSNAAAIVVAVMTEVSILSGGFRFGKKNPPLPETDMPEGSWKCDKCNRQNCGTNKPSESKNPPS